MPEIIIYVSVNIFTSVLIISSMVCSCQLGLIVACECHEIKYVIRSESYGYTS